MAAARAKLLEEATRRAVLEGECMWVSIGPPVVPLLTHFFLGVWEGLKTCEVPLAMGEIAFLFLGPPARCPFSPFLFWLGGAGEPVRCIMM